MARRQYPQPARLRFWPDRRPRRFGAARPFALAVILAAIWPLADPALVEPVGPLASEPERVNRSFSRCGRGPSFACVVDGDTFKLGPRKIRVIGIDAPEVAAQCPEEARLAEAATTKLRELLNDGEFEMVGRVDDMQDRYGRDLRAVRRLKGDGTTQSIAADMRDAGLARRYLGGFRAGWC